MNTYREIQTEEQWEHALAASSLRPLFLLKHSTRCEISAHAIEVFETCIVKGILAQAECAIVKVVESRDVSRRIALDTSIVHHSPQVQLIRHGQVVWSANHWAITEESLSSALI